MQHAQISEVVERTSQLVAEYYVFPDIGAQLASVLTGGAAAGRYAAAEGPASLANLVTEDLQSINGDRQLRLRHHADGIEESPGVATLAEQAREAAVTMGGVARVERLAGNIGYLDLNPILFAPSLAGPAITAAMQLLAGTEALIIDVRRNGGGDPATVALLCSYLFDEPTHLRDMRLGDRTEQSWTLPYVPGPRFGGAKPVTVLTSASTFSAAEELAYDLQQLGRASVVGERTAGGAHPRTGFTVHPHLEVTIPTGLAINPVTGTNWDGYGVVPDIGVPADEAFIVAYREASEFVRR